MSPNIWFTSDTHWHHKNICRGTSEWKEEEGGIHQKTRDFATIQDMDDTIVDNFNSLVKEDDVLYHLGDWSFGGYDQIPIFRRRLICKEIHLIFGNHDQHIEPSNSPYRQFFASCQHYKEISLRLDRKWNQFLKQKICMFHYAMRIFNKAHHGAIHLYGHSHGTLPDDGTRSMDVGVDTHNMFPYHLDEILDLMLPRKFQAIDHHNSSTN